MIGRNEAWIRKMALATAAKLVKQREPAMAYQLKALINGLKFIQRLGIAWRILWRKF